MDRKLVWTETASGDIEAIVSYVAQHAPEAAARIGFGIYERAQILLQHPEAGTILEELREARWRKLIFRRWKSFTQFATTRSSLDGSGQQRWAKQTWRHHCDRTRH